MGGTAAPTVTATLLSEFPHENFGGRGHADDLRVKVVATDSDGTPIAAPATISVEVIDDQPSVEIARGCGCNARRRTRLRKTRPADRGYDRDHGRRGPGCDAGGDAGWSCDVPGRGDDQFTLGAAGSTQSATVLSGTGDVLGVLSVDDGRRGRCDVAFDPTPDSTGDPSFSFTATVTDADGDVDTDTHTISITDGAPPTSTGTLALVVDEKDLADGTTAGGNAGGDPTPSDIETGGLVFTSGSDAIASIKFDLAAGQPTTGTGLDGSITGR